MSAYIIFIRNRTLDESTLQEYRKLAAGAVAKHPSTRRVSPGTAVDVLEGEPAEGVIMLEFETVEAARAFYESPDYQAASVLRRQGGDYRVMIVEGSTA